MALRSLQDLDRPPDGIRVISTDVFDTLLLRTGRSERARIRRGEVLFTRRLAAQGIAIDPDALLNARLEAQRLAFRALEVGGAPGEVRLLDVLRRQLLAAGVPEAFVAERLDIEIAVEKTSLAANHALGAALRQQKSAGRRIVAISDTTLPATAVEALIRHFHGSDLIDRVYSSADEGRTKRAGGLFAFVAASERMRTSQMLHVGDDARADVAAAREQGFSCLHLPRPAWRSHLRRAGGAATEAGRGLRRARRVANGPAMPALDPTAFGRTVLGPIVAEFCLSIWLYADQAAADKDACLLFCARGGIGIREAFERLITRLGLPLTMPRGTLMVSRLVAARAALLARSTAALDELGREFHGDSYAAVAAALGGRSYGLSVAWRETFAANRFLDLLFGPTGHEVLADIAAQDGLFRRHLSAVSGSARRLILCDTGLYGSTQRLMAAGFPNRSIETIQFARANYKGFAEDHFPRVTGFAVEQNLYNPFVVETCVLRYWQLVESLFEPAVASVRLFSEAPDGAVTANCGPVGFGEIDPGVGNPLLTGVFAYIDTLGPGSGAGVLADVEMAWVRLKQAITRPTEADVACMEVGVRSVDFGRTGTVKVIDAGAPARAGSGIATIKAQLWREGAIVKAFPTIRPALLALLESVHAMRGVSARLHR
jgi:FMN phosphatase YigB (HAD superfamily)